MGQQGPPTDAAASTPDGARRRPWAPPIDYRDNRRTTQRWGQYWAPIGGQFCAPVDSYPAEVCLSILEYYAFDAGANVQEQARDNFRALAGSKLREMIYSQVGYDPTGQNRFKKWHDRIALNHQSAPKGFFHVFNEAHTIVYELIMAGAEIGEKTVVDISIGGYWSKYWEQNGFDAKYGVRGKYPHRYPDDHPQAKSNPQESWCYPVDALGAYREWLQDHYLEGGKFKGYLDGKVKKGDLAPSVAQLAIATITPTAIAN